jgi:TPR repeat protein
MTKGARSSVATPHAVSLEPKADEESPYALAIATARRRDPDEAVRGLMEKASAAGDPRAQYSLGTWYLHGVYGYPVDPARGVELLKRSARMGVCEAMFDLGVSYELAKGTRRDPRLAFLWYLRAAIRGDQGAIGRIANWYASRSYDVYVDEQSALAWYELAEAFGVDEGDAARFRAWPKHRRKPGSRGGRKGGGASG